MKTILLMRHAKSDWDDPGLADFDRPLAPRGLEDAPRMGRALARIGRLPERIVSSPARRARETAGLLAEAAGWEGEIAFEAGLYSASGDAWIRALRALPDAAESALLVAHSPGCEEAVALLLGSEAPRPLRFPTAALLCAESPADRWSRLAPASATLRWFLTPKVVKAL